MTTTQVSCNHKQPKFTPEIDELIRWKYENGYTILSLTQEYNSANKTITKAIKRAGGKIKTTKRSPAQGVDMSDFELSLELPSKIWY